MVSSFIGAHDFRERDGVCVQKESFHFISTSNSIRFFISHLPLLFSSLYIVDRSAFLIRTHTIHGFHFFVLGRPRILCVSEWLDHCADSEVGAVLSREHVSTRMFHPLQAFTDSWERPGWNDGESPSISCPPPTRIDSSFRISPCFFCLFI